MDNVWYSTFLCCNCVYALIYRKKKFYDTRIKRKYASCLSHWGKDSSKINGSSIYFCFGVFYFKLY